MTINEEALIEHIRILATMMNRTRQELHAIGISVVDTPEEEKHFKEILELIEAIRAQKTEPSPAVKSAFAFRPSAN